MWVIKTLLIVAAVTLGWFLLYFKDISPYSPTGPEKTSYEARLEKKRPPASFLNLDDSILTELQDSSPHEPIGKVPAAEIGKPKLFERSNKADYHF